MYGIDYVKCCVFNYNAAFSLITLNWTKSWADREDRPITTCRSTNESNLRVALGSSACGPVHLVCCKWGKGTVQKNCHLSRVTYYHKWFSPYNILPNYTSVNCTRIKDSYRLTNTGPCHYAPELSKQLLNSLNLTELYESFLFICDICDINLCLDLDVLFFTLLSLCLSFCKITICYPSCLVFPVLHCSLSPRVSAFLSTCVLLLVSLRLLALPGPQTS